ncbi:hypothetical protein [Luteolibacter sp. Populi]|uniref:hypothetical protein n=1 Tax=Luteolibacter sp. Populi TaxID=3230487 RepID=UPI00346624E8
MESPAFRRLARAVERGSLEPDIRVLREAQEDERQMNEAIELEKSRKNEKIHGPVKAYITGVPENESDRDQRDTPPHPYLEAARNREALRGQQQLMPFFQRMFRAPEEVDAIFKESQQARPFANGGLKAYRAIPPAAGAAGTAGRLPESRWMPADAERPGPAGQDPGGRSSSGTLPSCWIWRSRAWSSTAGSWRTCSSTRR